MKRPEPDFTMDEFLEELGRYFQRTEEDCYTTAEIAREFGRATGSTLRRLKELLREGKVEVTVKDVKRLRDGALVPVTAWRLKRGEGEGVGE